MGDKNPNKLKKKKQEKAIETTEVLVAETEKGSAKKAVKKK